MFNGHDRHSNGFGVAAVDVSPKMALNMAFSVIGRYLCCGLPLVKRTPRSIHP
jgi:hypothetical protein